MTRYWARYKGVQNIAALLAWGIPVALAAVLVVFELAPVYFLFPPAWILSVILYVVLARMMGAAQEHPDGEAADALFGERVEVFHAEQSRRTPTDVDTRDRRTLTRVLRVAWILTLVVIVADALVVLVASPDVATYEAHRALFFVIAAAGTAIYFVAAYWELRRRNAHTKRTLARRADRSPAASAVPGP